ncbi:2-oxo-4-hydroxy-4-carboxy-5-ureidoimidazoline decarboxylase [Frateuria aurantia]
MAELNLLDDERFITLLGGIFEHSPWVPAAVLELRPFASRQALEAAMIKVVEHAPDEDKLALICAHPELAGRAAIEGQLAQSSAREQSAAGLDRCTPEEFAELTALNGQYLARFGFPFVLAVQGHHPASVIAELQRRVALGRSSELAENLRQIERIASLRLRELLAD